MHNTHNNVFSFCSKNNFYYRDTELKISVYDYDECRLCDDLIGSTVIDIENRLRSKYRARCGLAKEYSRYVEITFPVSSLIPDTERNEG